ncbi:MAG: hypothetical protein E6Q76_07520 [Rhizobium sp.]|nr:MAG: hypothetical protein E6Q76_07520 [Rhizobium sp.]
MKTLKEPKRTRRVGARKHRIGADGHGQTLCARCHKWKIDDEFALKSVDTGLRHTTCKPCQRVRSRLHYERNVENYVERAARRRQHRAQDLLALVQRHLPDQCRCGTPITVKTTYRLYNDGSLPSTRPSPNFMAHHGYSQATILEELSKLTYVCPRCFSDAMRLTPHASELPESAHHAARPPRAATLQGSPAHR